jgi:adenylate kinase family enzyme
VIEYYKQKVVDIKADSSPDDVAAQIQKAL